MQPRLPFLQKKREMLQAGRQARSLQATPLQSKGEDSGAETRCLCPAAPDCPSPDLLAAFAASLGFSLGFAAVSERPGGSPHTLGAAREAPFWAEARQVVMTGGPGNHACCGARLQEAHPRPRRQHQAKASGAPGQRHSLGPGMENQAVTL